METTRDHHRHVGPRQRHLPKVRLLTVELLRRDARAVGKLQLDRIPFAWNDELELHEVRAFVRRRVHDGEGVTRNIRGNACDCPLRQLARDLLGLRVAHQDLCRHLVRRAAADRVVRRVLEHPCLRQREERLGPPASI